MRLGSSTLFSVILAGIFSAASAYAEPVGTITIRGQQKIEESAIRSKIATKSGDPYSNDAVKADVKELFKTGFFNNVIVEREAGGGKVNLTFTVVEKPIVSEIIFEGNDEADDDEMKETSGLKPYEILNMQKVREAVEKLEKLYEDKGFFLARVTYVIEPQKDKTVKLVFTVLENEKVRVAKVRFLGNNKISSTRLKAAMATQEGGFFSFISGSGSYKQEAFDRDVQALYYLVYYNEGYIQAKIDRPQVSVTPDKRHIYVTIRVEEGEKFDVGEVGFAGDLLFKDSELFEAIKLKKSELFVYSVMQKDLSTLQAKYGDLGYAYANVIPRTRIREKDRLVDITFEIDKGNKVYLGRINVKGNNRTRDKVVRREMRIVEGELYNETRKRESLENIKRLGYFEEVVFNTKAPQGQPDIMDIDVAVKERNTGVIQLGAGYSNYGGFLLNGQINQINLFGKGQRLGLSIDYSKAQSIFNLSFTEPYFRDSEFSVGGDIYVQKKENELAEYKQDRRGVGVRVGHPLAPYLDGTIGYKIDETTLTLNPEGDPQLYPVETANGITSAMTFSVAYDRRDDRFSPSDGMYHSAGIEVAGLGGDLNYTKGTLTSRYYKKIFWDVVWRNNLSYGIITSNDSTDVPFNQLYLLGGANNLRGYNWFSIGKKKYSSVAAAQFAGQPNGDKLAFRPFGGTQQLYYNLEFQFPLIEEAGVKGVVFYDIGYADDSLNLSDFRSDVGFGFRWFSPIGPLRFEWGFPFQRDAVYGERAVNFEFAIGQPF